MYTELEHLTRERVVRIRSELEKPKIVIRS